MVSGHEQIRLKVTAFLFNRNVDVLRNEVYRVLCLQSVSELGDSSADEIIQHVSESLGSTQEISESIKTIVYDTLNNLIKERAILCENDRYFGRDDKYSGNSNDVDSKQLREVLESEISKVALRLKPTLTSLQVETLVDFYLDVANLVAENQLSYLSKGLDMQDIEPMTNEEIVDNVISIRQHYNIDEFIDVDKFILQTFIRPSETLSQFLYKLIQVWVLSQLLAWDPSLEHLQNQVLKGKTIYLDSSAVFILRQKSHPLNKFVTSLLKASTKELGVKVKVQTITLAEYNSVIKRVDEQYTYDHSIIRDVANSCDRDDSDPWEHFDEAIYADFISTYGTQINLGNWQSYINSISGNELIKFMNDFPIEIDKRPTGVPYQEYDRIKEAMINASRIQVRRGKRDEAKRSIDHDAKLFNHIYKIRNRSQGKMGLGYDTYLFTLDGSLPFFMRNYGISWSDTYIIFPNQWYQLIFPFMRIKSDEQDISKGMTNLVFSSVFPSLTTLIPLELCSYVFALGGKDLPIGSVHNIVEGLLEARLVDSLSPSNKDENKKHEAELQVQRMVVDEIVKLKTSTEIIDDVKTEYEKRLGEKDVKLQQQSEKLDAIGVTLTSVQQEAEAAIEKAKDERESIKSEYDEKLAEKDGLLIKQNEAIDRYEKILNDVQEKAKGEQENIRSEYEERISEIELSLRSIQKNVKDEQRAKEEEKERRTEQWKKVKRIILTIIMSVGLLTNIAILIPYDDITVLILSSSAFLIFGIVLYNLVENPWWSFTAYGVGLLISIAYIIKSEPLLWLIPMSWEILIFGIDRILNRQSNNN